jgi:hypothetical protein
MHWTGAWPAAMLLGKEVPSMNILDGSKEQVLKALSSR